MVVGANPMNIGVIPETKRPLRDDQRSTLRLRKRGCNSNQDRFWNRHAILQRPPILLIHLDLKSEKMIGKTVSLQSKSLPLGNSWDSVNHFGHELFRSIIVSPDKIH